MVRGVPVVMAAGSGLDEVGPGDGLRLDPADVDGWAAALLRLQDDLELRQELRRQGLAAGDGLRWNQAASSYISLYRSRASPEPNL